MSMIYRTLAHARPLLGHIKRSAIPWVQRWAYLSGAVTLAARRTTGMRIIMLHGITEADHPLSALREQLEYLARHFELVPLDELVARFQAGGGSGREVVLTFDDGLRNNYTCAYPLLRELGIPATFFVCPDLIESGRRVWTTEARLRLTAMTPERRTGLAEHWGIHGGEAESLAEWLRSLPAGQRDRRLAELQEATPELEHDELLDLRTAVMPWSELEAIDPSLVTIGSHTLTHAMLTTCTDDELTQEVGGSREKLEARLGRPIRFFCYPNATHSTRVVQEVRRYYDAAMARVGFVTRASDLYRLPRIPSASSAEYMAWRLLRPEA